MPCQKYQIFIVIFIFWQCNLFNLLCIGNTNFLILAFAIQMFCIFCIGNILFFHFWHWECKSFFIFGTGNAFFKNFWHWECKFLLFFALGMQIFFIFRTGNASFFFSIDENDSILKTFLLFKCTKLTISFCNLYLPQKHPLALDFGWPKKV